LIGLDIDQCKKVAGQTADFTTVWPAL